MVAIQNTCRSSTSWIYRKWTGNSCSNKSMMTMKMKILKIKNLRSWMKTWLLSLKPNTNKRCRWSWLMRKSKRWSAQAYWNKLKAIQVLRLSFKHNSKWRGKERQIRSKPKYKSKKTSTRVSLNHRYSPQLLRDSSRTTDSIIRTTTQLLKQMSKEDRLCIFKSHPGLQSLATHSRIKSQCSSLKTMELSNHELHHTKI